jgi:hypothetical protein
MLLLGRCGHNNGSDKASARRENTSVARGPLIITIIALAAIIVPRLISLRKLNLKDQRLAVKIEARSILERKLTKVGEPCVY